MFKGYDWAELLPHFGMEYDIELGEVQLADLQETITSWFGQDEPTDMIATLRQFLSALIVSKQELNYSAPIFQGLLEVEEPMTFCRYFALLLPEMWT
jgi:hypothetical protein